MLTHRNLIANMQQASSWLGTESSYGEEDHHRPAAVSHLRADRELPGVHEVRRPQPPDHQSARHAGLRQDAVGIRFTAITGVNTLFNGLLNTPGFDKLDFSRMHLSLGGGMAVQRAVAERWKKVTGVTLVEAYGLTETSPAACMNPLDLPAYNGAIGLPISSTECSVQDEDGKHLAHGRSGRIVRAWPAGDEGLLAAPGGNREGTRPPMAGCTPATWRRWTRKASSTSWTARRT
jgi:long-chain acyl-CoA synthetase